MTREITHMKAFSAALESMGKPAFSIGRPSAAMLLILPRQSAALRKMADAAKHFKLKKPFDDTTVRPRFRSSD